MSRRNRQLDTCGVKYPVTVGRVLGLIRARSGKIISRSREVRFLSEVGKTLRPEWRDYYRNPFRLDTEYGVEQAIASLLGELQGRPFDEVIIERPRREAQKRQGGRVETPLRLEPVTVRDAQRMVAQADHLGNPYTRAVHRVVYAALDMPCGSDGVMACDVNYARRFTHILKDFQSTGRTERGWQVSDQSLRICQQFYDQLAAIDPSQVVLEVDRDGYPRPVGRFAPKSTDEVRDQGDNSSEDSQFHGGDGNSQEVEGSVAQTVGEMHPRTGMESSGDRSVSGNTAEDTRAGKAQPQAFGSNTAANSPGGAEDTADSTALSAASQQSVRLNCLPSRADTQLGEISAVSNAPRDGHSGSGSQPPTAGVSPKTENWAKSFSGCTVTMAQAKPTPALIKRAQQAFKRILDAGSDQDSPRRDYGEFCTRLKTYRNPSPARREEEGRPAILVVTDTSPSVGAIAYEALSAARAVGTLGVPGADVIVINADNGKPYEVEVNGKAKTLLAVGGVDYCRTEADETAFYQRVCAHWDIKIAVLIGDGDDLQCRAAVLPQPGLLKAVYLSSYCCSYGKPRKSGGGWMIERTKAPRVVAHKLTHWDRCSTAQDFVSCLED